LKNEHSHIDKKYARLKQGSAEAEADFLGQAPAEKGAACPGNSECGKGLLAGPKEGVKAWKAGVYGIIR
jgi:hypothetical protein